MNVPVIRKTPEPEVEMSQRRLSHRMLSSKTLFGLTVVGALIYLIVLQNLTLSEMRRIHRAMPDNIRTPIPVEVQNRSLTIREIETPVEIRR